jgi:hypothetical protein
MIDEARRPAVQAVCDALSAGIASYPLPLADALLDEARRFALTRIFSGWTDDRIEDLVRPGADVVALAKHYVKLSAAEIVVADGMLRLNLWAGHFANMPATRFGRQFAAAAQLAQAVDAGRKPN